MACTVLFTAKSLNKTVPFGLKKKKRINNELRNITETYLRE